MSKKMLNNKNREIIESPNPKIELAYALRINLRRRKKIKKKNIIKQDDKKP